MTEADFDTMAADLAECGYLVSDSRYDGAAFGSWWIVVESGVARFRVIWDGRDRWLLLQQERAHNSPSDPEWLDVWVERLVEGQTSAGVLAQLAERAAPP
jgi:hypothetical protein